MKCTKTDFWATWLDTLGPNCPYPIKTLRERIQEKEEGPWEEPSTASGARSQWKRSISQDLSRTRPSAYRRL
eukprot:9485405-Prorocentrum_lima.AAC.1